MVADKLQLGLEPIFEGQMPMTTLAGRIGKLVLMGFEHEDWTNKETIHRRIAVGLELLRMLFDDDKLSYYRDKKDKHNYIVYANEDQEDFIAKLAINVMKNPLPIYVNVVNFKPDPRTSFFDEEGGDLVHKVDYDNLTKFKQSNCPLVYDVVNKQQAIGFQVNTELLKVINNIQDTEIFTFEKLYKTLEEQGMSEEAKETIEGRKRENEETLIKANQQIQDDGTSKVFFEYYFLDFRSRLYPAASYFNHAGNKLAKSLFRMDNTKALGSDGWFWLLVHTANCWGEDKLSLDSRFDFVDDNIDWMLEIASDPINDTRWMEADEPFCFLAAILEIKAALDSGNKLTYQSGLIVHLDATLSGLQMLSLLSRDEKAGYYCNVDGSPDRGDFYTHVGDFVWKQLNESDSEHAKFWLQHHKNRRSLCKRSSMTKWYSCGKTKMGEHIFLDHFTKKGYKGITEDNCAFLGALIFDACETLMEGPAKLMKLFQTIGIRQAKKQKMFTVTSPTTGFKMEQDCRYFNKATIKFYPTDGNVIRLRYRTDKKDSQAIRDVITGAAPNAIHTLDASLVAGLILKADYEVVTIHDSYGTIPSNVSKLYEDVRITTVEIFSEDVLMQILEENECVDLYDTIEMGNLLPTQVLDDEFYVS